MSALRATAIALAARYAPGQLPATPAGCRAIRLATSKLPESLAVLPCILVIPRSGTFEQGSGSRLGGADWLVRLYYDQTAAGSLERQSDEVLAWLDLLNDQLKAGSTLGGAVVVARVTSWLAGVMRYAGAEYVGAELTVHTVSSDAFPVTA